MSIRIYTEKLVVDGKVAVLISPGFGAGWSTWAPELFASEETSTAIREFCLFDKTLIQMCLDKASEGDVQKYFETKYPGEVPYLGGWEDVEVQWVQQGLAFTVIEYDGSEYILSPDMKGWYTA